MKMINKILMCVATTAITLSASAQSADRESLGFFDASSYPQLRLPLGPKTYALLEEGNVAIPGNVVYHNASVDGPSMIKQANASNVDLIFNYTNLHEESPIEVERFEPKKRRQVIRIGNVVIKTRPKEVKEGPHHPRPGYACAYLYRDVSFYITVSKPDGTVLYENFVGESGEFNSGWWPVEHLAVDSVQRAASYLTLDNLIRRNSKTLKDLVGASYMMYAKKVTCYYGKKKKRTKGEDPYAEMNEAVEKLKKGSALIKINEWDIESFKSVTEGCVDVWEKELKNADLKDKNARINEEIACGLNYNIGVYYLFCKEYDKAAKYFKEVVMLDKRFGDCRYFAENCDKWQLEKMAYEKMMATPEPAPESAPAQ